MHPRSHDSSDLPVKTDYKLLKAGLSRIPVCPPRQLIVCPGRGRQSIKGYWLIFEERPGALASMNLRGSVCVCFPCVYINLEEQHLAKSGRHATDPRSSFPLSDAKPNLSASPRRLHSPSSLEPLSINTDSTPGHGIGQAPFNRYPSPPPETRIAKSPDPRGFNEATCKKPGALSPAPGGAQWSLYPCPLDS